ncbi:AbrB family transcriptional regulator [Streptomyces indonesiensis]
MVPGGSAAIVTCADELKADVRLVAFTQYLRVGLVATTAPLAAHWLTSASSAAAVTRPRVAAPEPASSPWSPGRTSSPACSPSPSSPSSAPGPVGGCGCPRRC